MPRRARALPSWLGSLLERSAGAGEVAYFPCGAWVGGRWVGGGGGHTTADLQLDWPDRRRQQDHRVGTRPLSATRSRCAARRRRTAGLIAAGFRPWVRSNREVMVQTRAFLTGEVWALVLRARGVGSSFTPRCAARGSV